MYRMDMIPDFQSVLFLLFILNFSVYFAGVLVFIIGNVRNPSVHPVPENSPWLSIIVAVRNGSSSLPALLHNLSVQNYIGRVEFILIDDHSTDNTSDIIESWIQQDPRFRLLSSNDCDNSDLKFKKRALYTGIQQARGEILLFTDADCSMGPDWAQSMVNCFSEQVDYVIGFSDIIPTKSLVSRFQRMDLFMLMASTIGITRMGGAWAALGQNQAYRKSLFHRVGGYQKISQHLQGDDSLFLQITRKYAQSRVVFNHHPQSFITGRTEKRWRDLLVQRIRWAGDTRLIRRFNKVFFLFIISVFLANLFLILSPTGLIPPVAYGAILSGKFFVESVLYLAASSRFNVNVRWHDFLIWFMLQIPYIVVTGLLSFFTGHFSWRGRKLR